MKKDWPRREFLRSLMGSGCALWAGCQCGPTRPSEPPIDDVIRSDPDRCSFVIDAHAHIFNGADFPLSTFTATKIEERFGVSQRLAESLACFLTGGLRRHICRAKDEIADLRKALDCPHAATSTPSNEEFLCSLRQRWEGKARNAADEWEKELETEGGGGDGLNDLSSIKKLRNFIRTLVRPRWLNAYELLTTYPEVDVFVAAFTDAGKQYEQSEGVTPISKQIKLLELIHRLYRGRILFFLGYDPRRDATENDTSPAMETVMKAVLCKGFVGIKLYPPTGFRPMGNADLDQIGNCFGEYDDGQGQFGARIDRALARLYDRCVEHDVPILAHTALSQAFDEGWAYRAHPYFWCRVFKEARWENLTLSLGHFGGTRAFCCEIPDPPTTCCDPKPAVLLLASIRDLLSNYPNTYADISSFDIFEKDDSEGDTKCPSCRSRVLNRLGDLLNIGRIPKSVLYGSDWYAIARYDNHEKYLDRWAEALPEVHRSRILGENAACFLGLHSGRANRSRLEQFYSRHGIGTAQWQCRMDNARAAGSLRG